jgi:uncharacterized membrane protein YphA (DoxX/SURF4 family)
MKTFLLNRRGQLILRVIAGGVFIYAGVLKALAPQEFADNIAAYQLLPVAFINLLTLSLPVFEIITGLMLITGFQLRIAAFSALVLSMVFGVALGSALARGLKIDCGCFGSGSPSTLKTWFSLGRDALLGGVAWLILCQAVSNRVPDVVNLAVNEPP